MIIDQKDLTEVHVNVAFEAPSYSDPDYIGFLVLNYLISSSDDSGRFLSSLGLSKKFFLL